MLLFIFIIFIIFIIVFIKRKHLRFDFSSFKYKGVRAIEDSFGVYLLDGKQGTNKTYGAVRLLLKQPMEKVNYIYTNIHSLKIPGYEIRYFNKLSELYFNFDEYVIVVADELSKKFDRNSKTDKEFYAWLNQRRKRKGIFIGITQEYLELPMWLRRPVRYILTSKPIPILSKYFNIFALNVGDGYNLTYDKEIGEYICPTIKTIIYKRNERVASFYDTFEPIEEL